MLVDIHNFQIKICIDNAIHIPVVLIKLMLTAHLQKPFAKRAMMAEKNRIYDTEDTILLVAFIVINICNICRLINLNYGQ